MQIYRTNRPHALNIQELCNGLALGKFVTYQLLASCPEQVAWRIQRKQCVKNKCIYTDFSVFIQTTDLYACELIHLVIPD